MAVNRLTGAENQVTGTRNANSKNRGKVNGKFKNTGKKFRTSIGNELNGKNKKTPTSNPITNKEPQIQAETNNIPKADENVPKASENVPKAGENAPKAGENVVKAGENAPKASENVPKAGENTPKAGMFAKIKEKFGNMKQKIKNVFKKGSSKTATTAGEAASEAAGKTAGKTTSKIGKFFKGKGGKFGLIGLGIGLLAAGGMWIYNKATGKKDDSTKTEEPVKAEKPVATPADGEDKAKAKDPAEKPVATPADGEDKSEKPAEDAKNTYTVKRGDNVWNIAKQHLKDLKGDPNYVPTNAEIAKHTKELMELNNLKYESDGYLVIIRPNQVLKLAA